jgi:hypothetical protein
MKIKYLNAVVELYRSGRFNYLSLLLMCLISSGCSQNFGMKGGSGAEVKEGLYDPITLAEDQFKKTLVVHINAGNILNLVNFLSTLKFERRDSSVQRILNGKVEGGCTALHLAVANADFKMTSCLLNNGADPNVQDDKGYTPLHLAASGGDIKVVELLLRNKRINYTLLDSSGRTFIYHLSDYDSVKAMLEYLLKDRSILTQSDNHEKFISSLTSDVESNSECTPEQIDELRRLIEEKIKSKSDE